MPDDSESPGEPAPVRADGEERSDTATVGIIEHKPKPAGRAGKPRAQLVVVANRLPVRKVKREGMERWETSPKG